MGKGSFVDNFQAAVVGMSAMEAKIVDSKLTEDADSLAVKEIQVKGLFAINKKYRLAFATSLFDETSGELQPVTSGLEIFQESTSRAFQTLTEVGPVEPGTGFISWIRVGAIIPDIIETPYSGQRKLVAILRLIDLDNRPDIDQGFHQPDHVGLLWQHSLRFEYRIKAKGYLEAVELRDKARLISIQVAMAVAMWNGTLGNDEGETLKNWVKKIISGRSKEKKEELRLAFNQAMKESYFAAKDGHLSLTNLTADLRAVDDAVPKYETVELCFDILAASGIETSDKARVIDLVAKALELDPKEIERIRDIKIVGLQSHVSQTLRMEDLLGIDQNWDAETIKRHLRSEFQKWNNRLTALPEGEERDNAQRMLNAISEARKKYG